MADFDFSAYLQRVYPHHRYHVQRLAGGLVNYTVRARREDANEGLEPSEDDEAPSAMVLKQAPPFVAALGADAPFSQQRQLVEAAVLRQFERSGPLAHLGGVRIPRLLNHDTHSFVLALEDLGSLVTLWDLFEPASLQDAAVDEQVLLEGCTEIGERVGAFFAKLHTPETSQAVREAASEADLGLLTQSSAREVVYEAAVQPVLQRLQVQGGIDGATARELFSRVEADFEREPYPVEASLVMGDFHPGCILVPRARDWAQPGGSAVDVGVIDWEFATMRDGRGVNGDMAQFLAAIHALLLSLPEESRAHRAVGHFAEALCTAYARQSNLAARLEDRSPSNVLTHVFRSAVILLGREIINQAVDRPWQNPHTSVEEMIASGAWYIARAGANVDDMLQAENWDALARGKFGLISLLFGLSRASPESAAS